MKVFPMLAGAGLISAGLPVTVLAQGIPAGDAASDDVSQGIADIIVTAQKRSESGQKVPISLIAINSESLEKSGTVTLDAVQRLAPGITLSTVGSGFVSYTYIRGAGTNVLDAGADPSVAFFVDEVYQAGTAGLQGDLLDVERVEVLKGPQGTLFGRNAAAGAISVITKKPEAEFNAWANGEVGLYNSYAIKGGITGPVSKDGKWRYRLAASHRERDGYTNNPTGTDPGYIDTWTGRGSVEHVGDRLNLLVSGDYFHSRNGMTNQFLSTAVFAGMLNAAAYAALPTGQSFYRRSYDVDGFEKQDSWSLTGRLEYDFDFATLTSISAYRNSHFRRLQDQDGTAADGVFLASEERDKTFSQELRLAGDASRLHWVLGGYFYHNRTTRNDIADAGPGFAVPIFALFPGDYNNHIVTESVAAFGQLSYDITDAVTLIAGGRYTRDHKTSDQNTDPLGPVGRYTVSLSPTWDSFDPAVTIQFKPSDGVMAYASYKQGFKSGGFQSLPGSATLAATVFKPEKVRAFEVGFKSNFLDRKVQLNAVFFHNDIVDQQILRVPAPAVTIIENAGKTKVDGVDASLSVMPVTGLRFDAAATWQHAQFKKYDGGLGTNYAGNRQLRSPDFTASFSGEYTVRLTSGSISIRGEYFHQSDTYFDAANTKVAGGYQPAYDLVNARISFQPGNGNFNVALFAKNILDKHYFRNIAFQGPTGLGVPGDPLTAGISISWGLR